MADTVIYLGNKNYSSWSLRAWLALKQTGIPFKEEVICLDQDDTAEKIRRNSPTGKVPCLVHDGHTVWESLAIGEYLAERFPKARLWPSDSGARAHARCVATEMHAGFAKMRQNLPMDIRSDLESKSRISIPEVARDVRRVMAIWRECRERYGARGVHGDGPFLYGGFSIADAMFAPVTTRFLTYGVPLDETCEAYVDAVTTWPAMAEWCKDARREQWTLFYPVLDTPVA
jgi:glutathione S-transferase